MTFYNLVSDQFTGLNGITVPGTLRDSLTLLSVVLEQQTEMQPTEIMSDTGAYTDTIFGIFHLVGYQFSPRLADIGGSRFWRVDGKANYGALDELAAQRINVKLIVQHWEDLLRLAGSLKLGTVQAAGLIRTLQTKDRPTKLARALEELGRLIKTLYLLRFIDDEAYRRRILVQLNRGEGRHQLARVVFHGKRGELRQRYREGQEDQLGSLGLVVNVIVLWNTIYMDAALSQLRAEGFDVLPEDVARLSPLGFDHIEAAVQRRPCEMRDARLQAIKAVVERQQRMAPEGNDHRLLLGGEHRRARLPGPHWSIGGGLAPAPFLDGGRTDAVAPRERPYALLT